jgi:hypothetical protein
LKGSAVGAAATADCVDCHVTTAAKTWTEIHTAALGTVQPAVDHSHANSTVSTSSNCSDCHGDNVAGSDATNAAPANTPWINAGEVHEVGCGTCHTGNNDGGFRSDGVLTKANTIVAGNCEGCHGSGTFDTIHTPANGVDINHSTHVTETASCAACHTDTGWASGDGTPYAIPVNNGSTRAADMVHDTCLTCHTSTNGKTMQTPGPYTTTITSGQCSTCHTAWTFDDHIHGTDAGYISHTVQYLVNGVDGSAGTTADNDTSQSTPQGCGVSNCHDTFNLGTWSGILSEHETGCARCHDYTDTGDGTPLESDVNDTLANQRNPNSCDSCHEPKTPNVDHGGHQDPDASVLQDADCTTTCHSYTPTGIHDTTTPVPTIHGNNCGWCHESAGGGGPLHCCLLVRGLWVVLNVMVSVQVLKQPRSLVIITIPRLLTVLLAGLWAVYVWIAIQLM